MCYGTMPSYHSALLVNCSTEAVVNKLVMLSGPASHHEMLGQHEILMLDQQASCESLAQGLSYGNVSITGKKFKVHNTNPADMVRKSRHPADSSVQNTAVHECQVHVCTHRASTIQLTKQEGSRSLYVSYSIVLCGICSDEKQFRL